MNELPLDQMLSQNQSAVNSTDRSHGWVVPELFIIEKAIVISVKTGVELDELTATNMPQFSINARIMGLNSNFSENVTSEMQDWFPPLFPNTIVSVPEIGEIVLILKENTAYDNKGYWIARSNDTDAITLKLAKSELIGQSPEEKYGMRFNVATVNSGSTQPNSYSGKRRYQLSAKLGDVFIQGRNGSFIRNSHNPMYGKTDKPGVLELGILQNRIYGDTDRPTVGPTLTKSIHIANSKPSDIGTILNKKTINPVDKIKIDNSDSFDERRINFIANFADDIYNVSLAADSESLMHRQVLGEKLNDYLERQDMLLINLMDTMKSMVNVTDTLFNSYINHTHTIPEINIDIPDKEVETKDVINRGVELEPQPPISVFVPSFTASVPPSGGREVTRVVNTPVGTRRYTETIAGSPGSSVVIPSKFITVPQPAKAVNKGYRTVKTKKKIEFDKITIGGEISPRNTTAIQTDRATNEVQSGLNNLEDSFSSIKDQLITLIDELNNHLAKRQFIN